MKACIILMPYCGAGETGSMYVASYKVHWYVHIYNSMVCSASSEVNVPRYVQSVQYVQNERT